MGFPLLEHCRMTKYSASLFPLYGGESEQLVLGVQLAKECLILYVCWHTVNKNGVGDVCRLPSAFRFKTETSLESNRQECLRCCGVSAQSADRCNPM